MSDNIAVGIYFGLNHTVVSIFAHNNEIQPMVEHGRIKIEPSLPDKSSTPNFDSSKLPTCSKYKVDIEQIYKIFDSIVSSKTADINNPEMHTFGRQNFENGKKMIEGAKQKPKQLSILGKDHTKNYKYDSETGSSTSTSEDYDYFDAAKDAKMVLPEVPKNPNKHIKRPVYRLPNIVSFVGDENIVGYEAKLNKISNPKNTIYDVRCFVGREFSEISDDCLKQWPFKVENNVHGSLAFLVELKSKTQHFKPENIISFILLKLRMLLAKFLNVSYHDTRFRAVVTAPVYFNDNQKKAMQDACALARIDATEIISECKAATLAYVHDKKVYCSDIVVVFKMNEYETQVTLLIVDDPYKVNILATTRDGHLGGKDIDAAILQHCRSIIYEKNKVRIDDKPILMKELQSAAEKAKCQLSSDLEAPIRLSDTRDLNFDYQLSRQTLETLCKPILQQGIRLLRSILHECELPSNNKLKIILAGGCTRSPILRAMMEDQLPNIIILDSIDQDELFANGAAVQAALNEGLIKMDLSIN